MCQKLKFTYYKTFSRSGNLRIIINFFTSPILRGKVKFWEHWADSKLYYKNYVLTYYLKRVICLVDKICRIKIEFCLKPDQGTLTVSLNPRTNLTLILTSQLNPNPTIYVIFIWHRVGSGRDTDFVILLSP